MRIQNNRINYGILVCTIGALFYCYEFILRILPGAMQNELIEYFGGISASAFGNLSALYYFAYSPMQIPVGMLMDKFGPRKLLCFACLCCTIGSFLFANKLIAIAGAGRFLVGFGSSFAFVGALTLAIQWLPKKYFSFFAGLITTLGMFGIVYGEVQMTALSLAFSVESVLYIMSIVGVIMTIIILVFVKEQADTVHTQHKDIKVFFKEVLSVLLSFDIWKIAIIGACLYTSLSVFGELWGKSYLEVAHGISKIEAAHAISWLFIGWAFGAPICGYVSDLTKKRLMILVLGASICLISILIILYCHNLSLNHLKILLFTYGFFSGTELIIFIMAKEYSGVNLSSTVFAVTNMIVTLGGVIFQPMVGMILDHCKMNLVYTTHDYQYALLILPLSLIFVLIMAFFVKNKK